MKSYKKHIAFISLVVLSFATRFIFLSTPPEVVFDEIYFGKFAAAYVIHEYYFDIHPPLAKMMIAGFASMMGIDRLDEIEGVFKEIGSGFDPKTFFALRFLPAFMGALIPIGAYLLLREIKASKRAAFLGSSLLLFDTAILGQSRFILTDSFFICFGVFAIFCYFRSRNNEKHKYIWLASSAALAGAAASVKYTAIAFLALILFMALIDSIKNFSFKKTILKFVILLIIPFIVYSGSIAIHFSLLKKSGPGDAYMSQEFQKTLEGNKVGEDIEPLGFWGKFSELTKAMYNYSAGITATHPYSSKWSEWPFGRRTAWYWTKTEGDNVANVYLIANPIIWWTASASVALAILMLLAALKIKWARKRVTLPLLFFTVGFIGNYLPFIGISRVAFLYHYLPPLLFASLITALLYDSFFEDKNIKETNHSFAGKLGFKSKKIAISYMTYVCLIAGLFFFLSPLVYGVSISKKTLKHYDPILKILD
ncbi:MAG: hypothetical protein COU07_03655 [Candidatus Harrisonbacteria bacterium CG10_big_fil_rev_8_21_14_0_10_40_38]|uniref:Polyprenol-phosphate-mannose--protein mannosyltransferase n=1 Tax=Candidatus Harrisonbacteria bacterium CG10_big_fil_rev_8_21_14_0_10_40_38 TaxID=1974583 RepID=A0A2H0URB6_9BACT|nr:MAG: hypothetical protein COU07_03655 [Candidatus Harrisonbacteria bacterium CG10_big_fil_rev_8_21_14_0_10_40_38]